VYDVRLLQPTSFTSRESSSGHTLQTANYNVKLVARNCRVIEAYKELGAVNQIHPKILEPSRLNRIDGQPETAGNSNSKTSQ
jgi:hypothetical protein